MLSLPTLSLGQRVLILAVFQETESYSCPVHLLNVYLHRSICVAADGKISFFLMSELFSIVHIYTTSSLSIRLLIDI